ncbi:MAG: hypothetical protein K2M64_00085, partial [Clostridia bacterium]|nr:hypothetical protein [Clostridia bacterium]
MKKTLSVVALLLVVSFALCACFFLPNTPQTPVDPANPEQPVDPKPSNPDVPPTQSRVQFTTPANGAALYDGVIVKVQDTVLPLYNVKVNNVHSWSPNPTTSRTDTGVGYFFLDGNVQVSVQSNGMTSCVVRPLSAGVTATVSNNVATFTISSAGEYSIEPNGDAQQAVFLFVSTFDEQTPVSTTANIIRFEKGVHNSANNGYINNNTVSIGSDTTVILEDGAVVQARPVANNASNVTICGTGIIDGSTFVRNA